MSCFWSMSMVTRYTSTFGHILYYVMLLTVAIFLYMEILLLFVRLKVFLLLFFFYLFASEASTTLVRVVPSTTWNHCFVLFFPSHSSHRPVQAVDSSLWLAWRMQMMPTVTGRFAGSPTIPVSAGWPSSVVRASASHTWKLGETSTLTTSPHLCPTTRSVSGTLYIEG